MAPSLASVSMIESLLRSPRPVPKNHPIRRAIFLPLSGLVLLAGTQPAAAQVQAVTGQVIDQRTQEPVVNALVVLVGTSQQSATDGQGRFRLPQVPAGEHTIQVTHLAYGTRTVKLSVDGRTSVEVRITLSPTAIVLQPVTVEALTAEERRARGLGYQQSVVRREQIAEGERMNLDLAEVLHRNLPNVRVRRLERVVGSPICIELRSLRGIGTGCQSPLVYLDGVPISNPETLYGSLGLGMIESMEVVPAAEAGARYGAGGLHGALLIQTRRPGVLSEEERAARLTGRRANFDWSVEPRSHRTGLVFASSFLGNAAGLGVGHLAARQCLRYRKPSYDGIVSNCAALPTIAVAAAAMVLPALGSSTASGFAGRTDLSQGRLAPATLGAAMTLLPGYALVMTGRRNHSDALSNVGYGILLLGPPILTTAADYLFRQVRGERPNPR